jgi:hypothetical protein
MTVVLAGMIIVCPEKLCSFENVVGMYLGMWWSYRYPTDPWIYKGI